MPAWLLGWFAGSVLAIRRSLVEDALRTSGVRAPSETARAMYAELAQSLFEVLWLAGAAATKRESILATRVVIDDELRRVLDRGGPLVLAVAHTGNWELVAYAASRFLVRGGRRLGIVVKPLSVRSLDAFITRVRASFDVALVSPKGAALSVHRMLDDGDVVAMPIDQVPERFAHARSVTFFGRAAWADRAPFVLARCARATVVVVGAARHGSAQHVRLLDVFPPHAAAAERATAALEAHVREHPSSWLWLHRRWRDPLEGSPAAEAVRGALVAPTQLG